MKNFISILLLIAVAGSLLSDCATLPSGAPGLGIASTPDLLINVVVTPTDEMVAEKPTPFADGPVAGACASFPGLIVSISIQPDVPSPRCTKVTGDQRLRVINETDQVQKVSLGAFDVQLDPGKEATSQATFAEMLNPGDYLLSISGFAGSAEIWLVED